MFDFEKFVIYDKAKLFNRTIRQKVLSLEKIDKATKDQLRRASLSIVLNVAESTSRFSDADKRNFFVIARGSLIECIAILDLLKEELIVDQNLFLELYSLGEELSKIQYTLIRSLEKK